MVDYPWTNGDVLNADPLNNISGIITIEAGENITSGNLVYIHLTDSKVYVSDDATQNDRRINGIAISTATTGNDVIIQTGGVYETTGLTDKQDYYLGNSGALSTTVGAVRIGTALSTTSLWINMDDERGTKIGEVISFIADATGVSNLTAYWQLCDGTTISDAESPMNGVTIRDINANNEFLRSADTSDMTGTGGTATHKHTVNATQSVPTSGSEFAFPDSGLQNTTTVNNEPPYMDVVMAIKIK